MLKKIQDESNALFKSKYLPYLIKILESDHFKDKESRRTVLEYLLSLIGDFKPLVRRKAIIAI